MCGEKYIGHAHGKDDFGSPPRVRGEVPVSVFALQRYGITPACAGRSAAQAAAEQAASDHSRVCGEKYTMTAGETEMRGSPPRVRGEAADYQRAGHV